MKLPETKIYLYAAVAVFVLIVAILCYYMFAPFSDTGSTAYLYIDGDDTQDSVFTKLRPLGSTAGQAGLTTLLRHSGYADNVRTGRYAIEPQESPVRLFRKLKNGQQSPVSLTVPEARTARRLAALLSGKLMVDSAEIAEALGSAEVCSKLGYDTCSIMAMIVPNTYEVYWNIGVDALLTRMQREHDAFWNESRRQKAAALQLTPNEVATLASIIDEETANNAEKPMIAGMYINRLHQGMPLQADPTIKFALKDFALRRIYQKLLLVDSPYNTYQHEGLPPGPIKVASQKGIDAVLNAVSHDYLYMCAKEDFSGTHNFAATYAEHLRNAARYAKALNERGIK